jgi:Ni,Fe-hydrogenase III component G
LKLPYEVSLVLDVPGGAKALPSIASLFLGASWQENDINQDYGIEFENVE